MAIRQVSLATLKDIDLGIVEVQFNQELERAVQDCADRPQLDKARSVMLQLDITPSSQTGRACLEFQVKSRIPPRRTEPYVLTLLAGGQLGFDFVEAPPRAAGKPKAKGSDEA